MKQIFIIAIISLSCARTTHHHDDMDLHHQLPISHDSDSNFVASKISQTATIFLDEKIEKVFPLFNPIDERKWASEWNPQFIYPDNLEIQEGMSFKTHGHGDAEEFFWIVTKYDIAHFNIQYVVSTPNRYWTITIQCKEGDDATKTSAEITYAFYAINRQGEDINKHALMSMYAQDLKDWEEMINYYLKHGEAMESHHH